jgi:hypothetical protein
MVNEVHIDFNSGEISGDCSDCTAADVADALVRIAQELRVLPGTPDYINYDEGKIFVK